MDKPADGPSARRIPVHVEIVGVAASGKSTLVSALTSDELGMERGWTFRSPRIGRAVIMSALRHRKNWIRALLGAPRPDSWSTRILGSLAVQAELLSVGSHASVRPIVLDQGPVFSAAFLGLHGRTFDNPGGVAVFEHAIEVWRRNLDAIVYLEATDQAVFDRLQSRQQNHRMDGKTVEELASFLAEYRDAYRRVIASFSGAHTCSVLELNTETNNATDTLVKTVDFIKNLPGGVR